MHTKMKLVADYIDNPNNTGCIDININRLSSKIICDNLYSTQTQTVRIKICNPNVHYEVGRQFDIIDEIKAINCTLHLQLNNDIFDIKGTTQIPVSALQFAYIHINISDITDSQDYGFTARCVMLNNKDRLLLSQHVDGLWCCNYYIPGRSGLHKCLTKTT